jgi:hypothetical protein
MKPEPNPDLVSAINELLLVHNVVGISASEIADVVYREIGEWTVKSSDYYRLAGAARNLEASCKCKLPPGWYALLENECRDISTILSP